MVNKSPLFRETKRGHLKVNKVKLCDDDDDDDVEEDNDEKKMSQFSERNGLIELGLTQRANEKN